MHTHPHTLAQPHLFRVGRTAARVRGGGEGEGGRRGGRERGLKGGGGDVSDLEGAPARGALAGHEEPLRPLRHP
eukprot:279565-Rhodomonas_salina.1